MSRSSRRRRWSARSARPSGFTTSGRRGNHSRRESGMQVAPNSEVRPRTVDARCVRLNAKAASPEALVPAVERRALTRATDEVLIEIRAAAVNPSDVKAATGLMPYAVFPRTPGRDYAGVIIDGPSGSVGREVFGSSGDLGIRRAGIPKPGETVLVMGVNGKVGQAAVQIATWHGARAIGVVRKKEPYEGHANTAVEVIDASSVDVATRVRELTNGKGADIVFNTVGDPYFQAAHN